MKYKCIVADPAWPTPGKTYHNFQDGKAVRRDYPYQTMTERDISNMFVQRLAADAAHLWLWTTNIHLEMSFRVMRAWGFKYHTTITWVKPSGIGNWFSQRTQHILFGYKDHCVFPLGRYKPTWFQATAGAHSRKPEEFWDLVESISPGPKLELFARQQREGWDAWGNEVESSLVMPLRRAI